jgi:hypothetical protein
MHEHVQSQARNNVLLLTSRPDVHAGHSHFDVHRAADGAIGECSEGYAVASKCRPCCEQRCRAGHKI